MYKLFLKKSAEKDLNAINEPFITNIVNEIEKLKNNPRNNNVKKLVGKENKY